MKDIRQILSVLSSRLTQALKDDLRRRKLVDTGKLLNSIKITPQFNRSDFSMKLELESEDYFIYLDERYKIMDALMKTPNVERMIEDAIDDIIEIIIYEEI